MDWLIRRNSRRLQPHLPHHLTWRRCAQHRSTRSLHDHSSDAAVSRILRPAAASLERTTVYSWRRRSSTQRYPRIGVSTRVRFVSSLQQTSTTDEDDTTTTTRSPSSLLLDEQRGRSTGDDGTSTTMADATSFDRSLLFASLEGGIKKDAAKKRSDYIVERRDRHDKLLFGSLEDTKVDSPSEDHDDSTPSSSKAHMGVSSGYVDIKSSPLNILKSHYNNFENGTRITAEAFAAKLIQRRRRKEFWTVIFTCPLTGRKFPSGRLREPFADDYPPVTITSPSSSSSRKNEENHVLYAKRNHAIHAAAARALDFIQFEKSGALEPRFCEEDPSQDFVVHSLDDEKVRRLEQDADAESSPSPSPSSSSSSGLPDPSYFRAMNAIENYYVKVLLEKPSGFVCKPVKKGGKTKWTASFDCPISGKRFQCGRLGESSPLDEDIQNDDDENDNKNSENDDRGVVYYQRKNVARRAAIARAYDFLRFQRHGIVDPRFCEEDPLEDAGVAVVSPAVETEAEASSKGNDNFPWTKGAEAKQDMADPASEDSEDGAVISVLDLPDDDNDDEQSYQILQLGTISASSPVHRLLQGAGSAPVSPASTIKYQDDDEGSYRFVQLGTNGAKSPLHRLLEVSSSNSVGRTNSSVAEAGPILRKRNLTGIEKVRSAIAAADAWVTSTSQTLAPENNTNVHRLYLPIEESTSTLLVGKAILGNLANANQSWPVDSISGVESWAKKIINLLWTTENSQPDPDAYTLYLKCLNGKDPQSRVEEAELIFAAMKNGEAYKSAGHVLPKPNQGTINALIQLTAQLGGTKGRFANHSDDSFVPDRESFLSVLSSCNYRPVDEFEAGGFDPVFAKECILRMTELATETVDLSLKPDTQVYNAPLRWSGGPVLWADSRPYARYIPWENYEAIFAYGLRENVATDDIRVRQAKDTEEWLNLMLNLSSEEESIAPNIETYEAVIQAWLKTATREGLDRAETLLDGLLNSSSAVKPRAQTFHPLIASWYHSGDPDSISKTSQLMERLEDVDAVLAETMKRDLRIIETQLMAHLAEQQRLVEIVKASLDGNEVVARVFDCASKCGEILINACTHLEQQSLHGQDGDLFLDVQLFEHCGQAWNNVSAACVKGGEKDHVDRAIAEVIQLFESFESIFQTLVDAETSNGFSLGTQKKMSTQLAHFVANAHRFFFVFLEVLVSLEEQKSRDSSQSSDLIFRELFVLEKMIRMVGEFEQLESHFASSLNSETNSRRDSIWNEVHSPDGAAQFEDQFSYGVRDDNRFSPTRYSLLWQAVKYLEEKQLKSASKGDIARLGFLIKNVGKTLRNSPRMEEAVDKIMGRTLPGSPSPQRVMASDEIAYKGRDERKRRSRISKGRSSSKTPKNRRHNASHSTKKISSII